MWHQSDHTFTRSRIINMLRAVIIDDEQNSREALVGKLDLFCPELEIAGQGGSVQEGLELLNLEDIDVLFLDIDLCNNVTPS